ncbi:helix-turn-helix domain-containing protein [Gordoniibacillus kamchatkensis]|uniref:helix-turn-helix domain-containing protein n=1 Tax=Gordoniibacillus kamchatkensis TaxID=1590651 RepID=UPI0006978DE3|nr:helix-turn-helix domain-containing protein [Paenibacillus sp. VKM B-2647]
MYPAGKRLCKSSLRPKRSAAANCTGSATWIGLGPKKFSEIVRFQNVVAAIGAGRVADWPALALRHGYFDQAHFIRDFKQFYGDTPMAAAEEYRSMPGK